MEKRRSMRNLGLGLTVIAGGVVAALLAAWVTHGLAHDKPDEPLFTRSGQVARWDPAVAFSLSRMHSYLSLGVPSDLVRERILSPALGRAVGRDGRALVANVLDYARELVETPRARRTTRKRFFRAVEALNQMLAQRGLPFFVYASFDWDDDYGAVEEVRFDALSISAVEDFRALDPSGQVMTDAYGEPIEVRVLHASRLGPARAHVESLGFTAPDYHEAFILPARITDELETGLLPMRDADTHTRLFQVHEDTARTEWYQTFRAHLASVARAELGDETDTARQRGQRALTRAVAIHEIQHQIDYEEKRAVRGVFRDVAARTEDMRLASAAMHEASAHLAQLARETVMPRVILAEIASYAFVDSCDDADCLAALVILDELASEFGHAEPGQLIALGSYDPAIIARRYIDISSWSSEDVTFAAQQAWTRLFDEPLPIIERVPPGR